MASLVAYLAKPSTEAYFTADGPPRGGTESPSHTSATRAVRTSTPSAVATWTRVGPTGTALQSSVACFPLRHRNTETMDYIRWRDDIFGKHPDSDPVSVGLLAETDDVSPEEMLDHIDRALADPDVHSLHSKEQIGIGLYLIYSNACSDAPFCYLKAGDEARRIRGIRSLVNLYSNYFERYCVAPVTSIGDDQSDGRIGQLCYMLWDVFVLCPDNASPSMVCASLDVMHSGIRSKNENCIVSAIHGLGHWSFDVPQAVTLLREWLRHPTTKNEEVREYAQQATTGCIN